MAEEKLDWFPVYWQRFIIGTLEMNAEEIGAYFLLLIYQWDKGYVPADDKELKKICRVSLKKLGKVLEKFEKIDEKLYNNTLEIIRNEQTEKTQSNSNRGRKGAIARWEKQKLSIANALLEHSLEDSKREEENRREKKREEESEQQHAPELIYEYMIGDDEIYSIEETFKEKFQIAYNSACSKYGELKIKRWIEEFSLVHKQKTWKDYQDFRGHISNFFIIKNQKDNESAKNGFNGHKKGITGTITTNEGKPQGKL